MNPAPPPRLLLRLLLAFLVLGVAGVVFLALDRSTLERGNLLFRSGEASLAADVYRERLPHEEDPERARYNLGTALLTRETPEAADYLRESAASEDPVVAARSDYNLGVSLLAEAGRSPTPDSTLVILSEVVQRNRQAIRRLPDFEDAVWNLALAERMLDSLGMRPLSPDFEVSAGDDETPIDLDALVRSETGDGASGVEPETPSPNQAAGNRQAAQQGARESWTTQDPGRLDREAAISALETIYDDQETLIRGLLWSLRPDIPWWEGNRYPGGGW